MSLLPSLSRNTASSRQLPELLPALLGQPESRQRQINDSPVQVASLTTLSQKALDLCRHDALADRVDNLGATTIEVGKNVLNDFARSLFGVAADAFSITYDSASVSAQSSIAASVSHSVGAAGTSDTAAFSLQDSTDFAGKGTITTKDGHRFSFEISVHFTSSIENTVRTTTTGTAPGGSDNPPNRAGTDPTPSTALNVLFPGNGADLFRLFDYTSRTLPFQIPTSADAQAGSATVPLVGEMTLRLLDLLAAPPANNPQVTNLYGAATPPESEKKAT